MALTIGDNFSYLGSKPLDGRIKYTTVAEMAAMADATLYDGCIAYCVETDATYQWKSTNSSDPTLGKWREFEAGGGTDNALIVVSTAPASPSDGDFILYTGTITGDFTESPALYVYDNTNSKWVLSTNMVEITAVEVDTLWANN